MNPKVSVIVPCYNQAQFLAETLDSVLAQTYENWECIIVNDGSTDNTESIAIEYCKIDKRFKYIKQQNQGRCVARNLGINIAEGEYVQFLDSDDVLLPDKLERQIRIIETEKSDVCLCHHSMFTTDINNTWENFFSQSTYDLTYRGFMYNWGKQFVIAIHSGILKKSFLDSYNIKFNVGIHALEDWLFWVEVARYNAKFSEIEDKLVLYRVHTNSTTHNKLYMQQNYLKSYFRMYEILSQQERKEFLQRGVDNLVAYFAKVNRNIEAETKSNSIDYKVGAFLMYPLHKLSSWLKHLQKK